MNYNIYYQWTLSLPSYPISPRASQSNPRNIQIWSNRCLGVSLTISEFTVLECKLNFEPRFWGGFITKFASFSKVSYVLQCHMEIFFCFSSISFKIFFGLSTKLLFNNTHLNNSRSNFFRGQIMVSMVRLDYRSL